MTFLTGKRALIVGVASKLSIATGIAHAMAAQGAKIAFTYQNEKLQSRVEAVAAQCHSSTQLCFRCDVGQDADIASVFNQLGKHWDGVDILVHAVGFAPREQLNGNYTDVTTREGFKIAHDISAYSLTALTQAARPMMANTNGSILTLTYLGAVLTMPNYNVMGLAKASLEASVRYLARDLGRENIRVNGISAGPVRTLAAAGINNFKSMLRYNAQRAPLGRNVTTEEIGNTAAFLTSDLASGITGQIVYVDGGFCTTAMGDSGE